MELSKPAYYFLIILATVYIGIFSALNIKLAVIPFFIVLFLYLIVKYGIARLIFISFGSLFIFQSSDNFNMTKGIFLIGLAFILIISFINILPYLNSDKYIRSIIFTGIIYCVYLIFNILFESLNGISILDGFRDCSSYIIFSLSPIMAYDFSLNIKKKHITQVFILIAIISTFIFIKVWMGKRYGLNTDTTNSIGLATYVIPYMLFAFCCSNAFKNKKKLYWMIACGLIFVSLAMTGTRTTFGVLPFVFLVILFSRKEISALRKVILLIKIVSGISVIVALSIWFLGNFTNVNLQAINDRVQLATVIFNKDSLNNDNSYIERKSQTQSAENAIKQSPFFGMGSGYEFLTTNYAGQYDYRKSLDTPLGPIAKHGVLGYLLFAILMIKIYKYAKHIKKQNKNIELEYFYILGFLAIAFVASLTLSFAEDKGASITMMFILGMAFSKSKNYLTTKN